MVVAFDTDVLCLLLNPSTDPPIDPITGLPVPRAAERLEHLVAELEKAKGRIIIPAPALAEFLVIVDEAGPDYLALLNSRAIFTLAPFDARAAVETAAMTREAIARGNKKAGASASWQCVKTDRQILAIAKTLGVARVYSNDSDMQKIATNTGIEVIHVGQLPLPPAETPHLPFESEAGP